MALLAILAALLFPPQPAIGEPEASPEQLRAQVGDLYQRGRYAEAIPLATRALAIEEKALGPEHPDVATSLGNLAELYQATGDYALALPLSERSLAIREKALGPEHPRVAASLHNLGGFYRETGDYARALPLSERSLSIREKALGSEHPDVARSLNNLALLYSQTGDLARAQPLYERSVQILEKAFGPEHPDVAASLNNLAGLYQATGDYARAQSLIEHSLAIVEKTLGPDHPRVAAVLLNLAAFYRQGGNYARARPLLERSLAIQEKTLGSEHPDVAGSLGLLAVLYSDAGHYELSRPLFQRSLAILEKVRGPEHPAVALSLGNLARTYEATGNSARARMLYERALVIIEKAIGPEHGEVARLLNKLAHLRWVRGDVDGALPLFERAQEVEESQRSLILPMGSEDEAQAYLDKSGEYLQVFLSLARLRPQDARAMHLALTAVLRTKGRVLEVTAGGMESLRRAVAPEDRALLDALVSRRAQLAQIELRDPGAVPPARYRELVGSLRAELEEVERQALRRGGALRVATEPVRLEAIQARIPADAALVEVVAYRSYRSRARPWRRWGQERLAGFVLRREGDPRYADLGPLDEVTRRAFAYREALQGLALPAEERRARAQALHQTVLAPLAPSLEGVDHLLIAPDAALHLVPFAALEDGEGRLLVERLRITYLTSGRDLLRLGLGGASREAPLLVAAPDFDGGGARAEQPPTPVQAAAAPRRSRDFAGMRFAPLPGTRDEATALARLLGVEALTGARAREAALKGAHGPRVLHLATHGFFLADQAAPLPEPRDLAAMERRPPTTESALLRSGLAFTGANRLSDGEDDGILTALELAGLDLTGTQLLVLSACETGLGEVRHGEGVYGLRRAALLAGAEAQLVSLWKVADEPTRRLMESYYRRLLAGEGRSEALRQVQLEMLRDPALAHPYYWAGFVSIGAWGPLALPAKR